MDKKELVTRLLMVCQTVDRLEDIGMALSGSSYSPESIINDFVKVKDLLLDIVLEGLQEDSAEYNVMFDKYFEILNKEITVEKKAELMMKIVDLI